MEDKNNQKEFIKVIYFDSGSAQDYLDIENGGHLGWNKEENNKRAAQILAEVEARAGAGFNIINFFKAAITGKGNASISGEMEKLFDSTLESTMLTDFLEKSKEDKAIIKIPEDQVIAPLNSATLYKMISSYLTIVPKDQLPIDVENLNSAILDERGYYGLLLKSESEKNCPKKLLRFNIDCFKNNYNLADLAKMTLTFYGIKVGTCMSTELSIDKEFILPSDENNVDVEQIMTGKSEKTQEDNKMDVIDVILAGVTRD